MIDPREMRRLERHTMFREVLCALLSKPGPLIEVTPPNRDGVSKPVSKTFASAVWAMHITRSAMKVLEEDEKASQGSTEGPENGSEAGPF